MTDGCWFVETPAADNPLKPLANIVAVLRTDLQTRSPKLDRSTHRTRAKNTGGGRRVVHLESAQLISYQPVEGVKQSEGGVVTLVQLRVFVSDTNAGDTSRDNGRDSPTYQSPSSSCRWFTTTGGVGAEATY